MAERLDETTLFVAATRPALILGLPIGVFVLLLMAAALIVIFARNPLYAGTVIPAWFAAQLLVRYDYNATRVCGLWLQTKCRSIDTPVWGGASPAPFPVKPSRHPRGILAP
jgi:type IV secretion system protein VirB3